ncbi:tRNA (adenosine(37)-N6)-threonylcarbamoyltransferase complex ATPase subunit type 1 TsaE [Syntrophomonas erecta]
MNFHCLINDEGQMEELGKSLGALLRGGELLYLKGELGAGKTTLVRGIARGMGYQGRVTSPTFTLMNIYATVPPVYHFDFYRLGGQDLADLGLEDYLGREGICIIEWPEMAGNQLPKEALQVDIELINDDYERERRVVFMPRGERYLGLMEELEKLVHFSD